MCACQVNCRERNIYVKGEKLLETYRLILDDIEQTFLHLYPYFFSKKNGSY